jgi:hypothetical protein
VTRKLVEQKVLETVKTDLRDPEIMAEIESRVAQEIAAQKPKADHSPRIGELQREVGNLTEAIASGLLKASPALAKRLAVTESELSRLQAERNRKQPALDKVLPRIGERYLEIVEHLEEGLRSDPELARAALTDAIGSRITLEPDESGKFLWAEFGLETTPQLVAVGLPEFMVAGAGFRSRLPSSNSVSPHPQEPQSIPHGGGGPIEAPGNDLGAAIRLGAPIAPSKLSVYAWLTRPHAREVSFCRDLVGGVH